MPRLFHRLLAIPFLFAITLSAMAQDTEGNASWYAAARSGLNLREKPDATSKLIVKLPFGAAVTLLEAQEERKKLTMEEMHGYWRKVSYEGKTGYLPDVYLLPVPPPKVGTKDMKEYLAQLAKPFGKELHFKGGDIGNEENGYEIRKQLFENGAEWHHFEGAEYGSNTYYLPEISIQQGFLILRMLPEFAEVFKENDAFPGKNRTFKKGDVEYRVRVEQEMYGPTPWIERIRIDFEPAAIYSFEIRQIDNQLVIFFGAGV